MKKNESIGVRKSSKGTHKSVRKTHGMDQRIAEKDIFVTEGEKVSIGKMKLQLFPINKGTHIELEKAGQNPYLELTVGGEKKICAVLKHLKKKWGSSMIAFGDPMIFPYVIMDNLSNSRRWTLDDCETTVAAVHAAIGSPAIFRLRYGWFSTNDPRFRGELLVSFPLDDGLQTKGTLGGGITNSLPLNDVLNEANTTYRVTDVSDATNVVGAQMDIVPGLSPGNEPVSIVPEEPALLCIDALSNISIGALLSEESFQDKLGALDSKLNVSNSSKQPIQEICDLLGLSNISIGGLLSETSLQGKLSTIDSKLNVTNAGIQPTEVISNLMSVSNVSIGGPFSKASLQGKLSTVDSKLNVSNVGMQPIEMISNLLSVSNISSGKLLAEASLQGKLSTVDSKLNVSNADMQSIKMISDLPSVSNISIGELLAEASLQAKLSTVDSKLNVSNASMQPTAMISNLPSVSNISIGELFAEASLQAKLNALDSKLYFSNEDMQPTEMISNLLSGSNISIGEMLAEASLQGRLSTDSKLNVSNAGIQPTELIFNLLSVSNISVGELLAEASLQAKLNALDSKLNFSDAGMQPSQIISDSLDAFIVLQNNHPKLSTEVLRPSILDVEETCHTFPLQKFSCPSTHVQSSTGKTLSGPSSLDISKSFKVREEEKVNNNHDGSPQDFASQRNETELPLHIHTIEKEVLD